MLRRGGGGRLITGRILFDMHVVLKHTHSHTGEDYKCRVHFKKHLRAHSHKQHPFNIQRASSLSRAARRFKENKARRRASRNINGQLAKELLVYIFMLNKQGRAAAAQLWQKKGTGAELPGMPAVQIALFRCAIEPTQFHSTQLLIIELCMRVEILSNLTKSWPRNEIARVKNFEML
jgi:hypothetical protein